MTLAFLNSMSKRYIVVAEVGGKMRFMSLTASTVGLRDARKLSRRMAAKLFRGQKVGKLIIQPWPKSERQQERMQGKYSLSKPNPCRN